MEEFDPGTVGLGDESKNSSSPATTSLDRRLPRRQIQRKSTRAEMGGPGLRMLRSRNVASRARWVEEAGAAEVLDSKGKLWLTTGVTRGGKLDYNVEEIGFLAERGALIFLDDEGGTIGMEEIYGKIAGGKYGCSWDAFQAYKHLKLLGYIIGRYGVPWTMKHNPTCETTDSLESMPDTNQSFDRADGVRSGIAKLLKEMHIDGLHPSFEVYLPNSKFRKSSPGAPCFFLSMLSSCITSICIRMCTQCHERQPKTTP
ncbi:unnamed protein product [Triticum turgidum subsp. durum]|uniref:tRNA-splicing endonuclease subunit Sen54 N-terminal domain-containing protein n=1 Tax=Triticum turgidum subsp. durum TaxID=4567 RepID=A0A9R0WPN1_TRITD|nr:unnamed protein product [Triticum turgidum subsp. durum]